jgi:Flp pilus assembly protein TadD
LAVQVIVPHTTIEGDAWMDLAKVLRIAGKPAEAEQAARKALALFVRKGNRPSSAATRAFIDGLPHEQGG